MVALVWGAWSDEWALNEKVSFNGFNRVITVNEGVTSLDIRSDVYSAWVRWITREANLRFAQAMKTSGADPIPNGETGLICFLTNSWKLCYNPSIVSVTGVLYSEDLPSAFWSIDGTTAIYPSTVSSLVNSAVTVQNVVTGTVVPADTIADAVRVELAAELAKILTIPSDVLNAATTTPIHADIRKVKDQTITGTGTELDPWGA